MTARRGLKSASVVPLSSNAVEMTERRIWQGQVANNDTIQLPRLRMPFGMYVLRIEGEGYRSSVNLVVD